MTERAEETKWTKEILMPTLWGLGFGNVAYCGGAQEVGRDVVFSDFDNFGITRYYGAQVKWGDLGARSATGGLTALVDQLKMAWQTPYTEPSNGRTFRMTGVYAIITGSFSDFAKKYLAEQTGQWLHLIDGARLESAKTFMVRRPTTERLWTKTRLEVDINMTILPILRNSERQIDGRNQSFTLDLCPTRSLEEFTTAWFPVLNPFDAGHFIAFEQLLRTFNFFAIKLPVGSYEAAEIEPTIQAFRSARARALSAVPEVVEVLEFLKTANREATDRFPPSPVARRNPEFEDTP